MRAASLRSSAVILAKRRRAISAAGANMAGFAFFLGIQTDYARACIDVNREILGRRAHGLAVGAGVAAWLVEPCMALALWLEDLWLLHDVENQLAVIL